MPTTKTKTFADTIADAEAATRARAFDLADQLTGARSNMSKFNDLHDAASAQLDHLADRLRAGDGSVSVEEFGAATTGLARAELLAESPARIVARLERAQVNTDTQLAEAVASAISPTLPGVPAYVVTSPKIDAPTVQQVPVLLVTQAEAPEPRRHGRLKGRVSITLYRTAVHKTLDHSVLSEAFATSKCVPDSFVAPVLTTDLGDGMSADTTTVRVDGAYSPTPLIPAQPTQANAERAAGLLAAAIQDATRGDEYAARTGKDSSSSERSWEIVSSRVNQGRRTTVVDAVATYKPAVGSALSVEGEKCFVKADLLGRHAEGVGVVTGVEDILREVVVPGERFTMAARLTLTAKVA